MKRLIDVLSSLGLACLLLLAMFFLTFYGTLYQVDHGLYEAKQIYFSSWFLWTQKIGPSLPYFPGGLTCMSLLTVNMFLGGFIRMRITQRNIGVVIIHGGVAFMLLAGLVKTLSAEEGKLTLPEGSESNFFDSYYDWEVAIWDLDAGPDQKELVIPGKLFSDLEGDRSRRFKAVGLPFELALYGFLPDSRVLPKGPNWRASGPIVDGYGLLEGSRGKQDESYVAGIHAQVFVNGQVEEGLLWGRQFHPWTVQAAGRRWAIDMRHERYEMPFTIRLEQFEKEEYPGSSMAKAFRSTVTKIEGDSSERLLIQMNEPLRSDNLVLFQSSYGSQGSRTYSVFSVVRNISDGWPNLSMWIITLGMLLTFTSKLYKYILRENKYRAAIAAEENQ